MEKRGVPTVTICTEPFGRLAESVARGRSMPSLPVLLVSHPQADRTRDEVEALAATLVDRVVAALTAKAAEAPLSPPAMGPSSGF